MCGEQKLTDMDKLAHLLDHWQHHNDDHEGNYREWSAKAKDAGLTETAEYLRQAAEATARVTALFTLALAALKENK